MSRILFFQCFRHRRRGATGPRFDQQIGVLSTVLRQAGHETSLIPVTRFDAKDLLARVSESAPDLFYAVIDGTAVDLARRMLGLLKEEYPLPAVAGGQYPTIMPSTALSMPGVIGVVVGEPERSFPAFVEALARDESDIRVPGVCTRTYGRNARAVPGPLVEDTDSLPFADRELFGATEQDTVFEIVTSRGCPQQCAYCVNDSVRELYDDSPTYVRRRSPDHICDEIDAICMAYPETTRLHFSDHAFAMDYAWLRDFALVYEDRCGLPFSCHVRANSLDEGKADLLEHAGCECAEVEVISGSNFIRNEILQMETARGHIERSFTLLRNRGIRTRAVIYAGVPYSSEITEMDTVKLNRHLQPDMVDVRVYYPFEGTQAAVIAREMGWLSNRSEESFAAGKSVLDMPTLPAKTIQKLARRMPADIYALSSSAIWRAIGRIPLGRGKILGDVVSFLAGSRARPIPQRRWF